MSLFKRKATINEETLIKLIRKLEKTFVAKDIDKLTDMFHPDHRDMSFLNHFSLMMTFQIYNVESQLLNFEILEQSEQEAAFTYTRKHMYTCVNEADENGDNPNNITSFYVQVQAEGRNIWVTRYQKYSEVFLDGKGDRLPDAKSVVPARADYFENMERFLPAFTLENLLPVTYTMYNGSEMLMYTSAEEIYAYNTKETFTIDYYEEMEAPSIADHTATYLQSNEIEFGEVLAQEKNYCIVETKVRKKGCLQHEIVLSISAADGFYMMRYVKDDNDNLIEPNRRKEWVKQMLAATSYI
ncbi:hypothetical protein [Terribacillus sp. JSM ZJ617]|uniref:hypothetical protein n=1 Tax=Terribacillus sp. JSM ZJ617 TaxID=3342119 RepID=UPI0035A8FE34